MKKHIIVSVLVLFSALFFSLVTYAGQTLPGIYINNEKIPVDSSFVMSESVVYIKPEKMAELFATELFGDAAGGVYTFSTPLRNATYDPDTGSLNITDKNSFLYEVYPRQYPSYSDSTGVYFPLRMICRALGHSIEYVPERNSVVINTIKDAIGLFNTEGTAIAVRGDKYGLVDRTGQVLMMFAYDEISNYDNPLLFKLTKHHRCGLADTHGNELTEIVYNEIRYESPSSIYIRKDRRWGMCDITGTIIVPVKYEDVAYCSNLIAMVKSASKWHVLDCRSGEISAKFYDEVYKLTTGVQTDNNMINGYYVEKNNKWGYIDSFGSVVIDIKYDALDKFDQNGRARFVYKNKFGVVDCGGQELIPAAFDYIGMFGSLSVAVAQVGDKYGIINDRFEIAVPFEYDYLYSFNDAPTTVAYKDGYFGLISTTGGQVTPFKYTYMEEFKNGLALAYDGGYGYVNHAGEEVIDTIHSEVKQGTALSVFLKYDDMWAIYAPNGRNLTGFVYKSAGPFANGLSAVSVDVDGKEKYGYVNDSGDIVIDYIYDGALDFKYGKAVVKKGTYSGIIDVEGKTIIPFNYTGFNSSYDYNVIAAADASGKWGLISFKNEILCDFKYDYIFEFEDGFAYTIKNHKYGVIDQYGNELAPPKYKTKEAAYQRAY